jgi:hypothetical protein
LTIQIFLFRTQKKNKCGPVYFSFVLQERQRWDKQSQLWLAGLREESRMADPLPSSAPNAEDAYSHTQEEAVEATLKVLTQSL